MKIISLDTMARELAYAHEDARNLEGAIRDSKLLQANLRAMQERHHGAFAYLAFHPSADSSVGEYVLDGSAGLDAGSDILLLFLSKEHTPQARELVQSDLEFGVTVKREVHPSYRLAARFFLHGETPRFPGLILFDKLVNPATSIYVFLDAAQKSDVRLCCRKSLEAARASIVTDGEGRGGLTVDFDRLAAKLFSLDIAYVRAGEKGVRSATLIFGAWVKKNAKSIVCAIPKIVGGMRPFIGGGGS